VVQRGALWDSGLQRAAVCCCTCEPTLLWALVCMAVGVAVCFREVQRGSVCYSVVQCCAVRCSAVQCVVGCCSLLYLLQCVAVCCRGCAPALLWAYESTRVDESTRVERWCVFTATHCNTLQQTATHCNKLQHTATHCNAKIDPHSAVMRLNCNILQRTATHCNTLHHSATHCSLLQHTATQTLTRIVR